jgi:REP element-mobilizing transposase RayT
VRKESQEEAGSAAVNEFADRTFFVTSVTWGRRSLFRSEPSARLLLETLSTYRERGTFQLYEFVLMADHIHLLLAPNPPSRSNEPCNSSKAAILIVS